MTARIPGYRYKMKRTGIMASTALLALTLAGCGSGFSDDSSSSSSSADTGGPLNILIGSSGEAESASVKAAVSEWSEATGNTASVNVAADLQQQLSQGFASGNPADIFYVSADQFSAYAANGSLEPYGEQLENKSDFYPALTEAFTYDDQLYCAPKDFSTLGLVINDDLWEQA